MKYITAILAFAVTALGLLARVFSLKAKAAEKEADDYQERMANIDRQIEAAKTRRKQADEAIESIKPGVSVSDINDRMRDFNKRSRH